MKSPGSCSERKQRLTSSTAAFWVVSVAFKSPSGAMRFQPKLLGAGWRPGRWLCQRSAPRRSPVTCSTRGHGAHVPLALSRGAGPPSVTGVSAREASRGAREGLWRGKGGHRSSSDCLKVSVFTEHFSTVRFRSPGSGGFSSPARRGSHHVLVQHVSHVYLEEKQPLPSLPQPPN